jgi:hypothetical protein
MTTQATESTFSLGVLEERVTGLERGVAHINASLDQLGRDIRERQKFPWPAIWGGASFLLAIVGLFGGIVIWGFNSYLATISGGMAAQQAQIIAIQATIVPRGEHQGHWDQETQADANLQRQIDEMRASFGSAYTLNDTLKGLQSRLDRLEELRLEQSKTP